MIKIIKPESIRIGCFQAFVLLRQRNIIYLKDVERNKEKSPAPVYYQAGLFETYDQSLIRI